jgi:hypothetical protein
LPRLLVKKIVIVGHEVVATLVWLLVEEIVVLAVHRRAKRLH